MKSRYWNWLINSILALLYSLAILILFEPWLRFVYTGAHFGEVETAQRLWMVGSTLAGIILADRLARLDRGLFRVLIVIAVLILAVLLIYWLEWPLVVFAPVLLLMFIFGFRFTLYETLADYNSDFILGIFFLLLNILVQNKIELHFDYLYVISFFLVGISFTVIYNIKHLGRGLLQHRNFLAAAIIICLIFSTIIFSLLMSSLLDRANLDMAVQALGRLYSEMADFIFMLFAPVIYVMLVFFYTVINFIITLLQRKYGELGFNPETFSRAQEEAVQTTENVLNSPSGMKYLPLVILVVALLFILSRLYMLKKRVEPEAGFSEKRESIFTSDDLKKDLHSLWSHLSRRLLSSSNKRGIYDSSSAVISIRKVYRDFLLYCSRKLRYQKAQTPEEYLKLVRQKADILPRDDKLGGRLTRIYERARYDEKADWQDVKEAERILHRIKEDNQ